MVKAGFPAFAYSEVAGLLMPMSQGPVAEVKRFMEALQKDVLSDPSLKAQPVVILAHSRSHFPPAFKEEEHLSVKLSHAEELWDPALQAEVIKRLHTFR